MSDFEPISDLRLPVFVAPMYAVSNADLVIASCKSGVAGTFTMANTQSIPELNRWMERINIELRKERPSHRFWGVSIISRKINSRFQKEIEAIFRHQPPFVVAALGGVKELVSITKSYGGMIYADVVNVRQAQKAVSEGVDGLVLICAGAGGHTGYLSPFAFVDAVREFWDGTIILGGGISSGTMVRASLALGVNAVYMGTYFIAANESSANQNYLTELHSAMIDDVVTIRELSGIKANFLKNSIDLAKSVDDYQEATSPDVYRQIGSKFLWSDYFSSGHGVGKVKANENVARLVQQLEEEFYLPKK